MRTELQGLPEAWPGEPTWFWHGEQILALLEEHRPVICVELDAWKGGSAIPTARLVRRWGGVIYCVDAWQTQVGQPGWYLTGGGVGIAECACNISNAGVGASVRLIQSGTVEAAKYWIGGIDYLYVDADHSYQGCLADLVAWWPHLKVGGLIAGDDYDDPRHGVTQAWDKFEQTYGQSFLRKQTLGTNPPCTKLVWGVKR